MPPPVAKVDPEVAYLNGSALRDALGYGLDVFGTGDEPRGLAEDEGFFVSVDETFQPTLEVVLPHFLPRIGRFLSEG